MSGKPLTVEPSVLDALLAHGWYRMGRRVFTTEYITENSHNHHVYWIRYRLADWTFHPQKLEHRNRCFSISVGEAYLSAEIEKLFAVYRHHIPFNTADSVEEYLEFTASKGVFNTYIAEIRDDGKLIAVGYFDIGQVSAAGILNFYHPDYSKSSPGKFLIKIKTDFLKHRHFTYFYPGYISPTFPKFDYKIIDEAAVEFYQPARNIWLPYSAAPF